METTSLVSSDGKNLFVRRPICRNIVSRVEGTVSAKASLMSSESSFLMEPSSGLANSRVVLDLIQHT